MSGTPKHVAINFDKGEVPFKKYGAISNIKCDLICASSIGSYREPRPELVEEHIQHLHEWGERIGFPKTRCIRYEDLAKTGGALSMYLAPNIPAKSDKIRAFGKYAMWLLLMDDIMDEKTMEHPRTTTYANMSLDMKILMSILNGDRNGRNPPPQHSTMSHFPTLCRILQEVHDEFSKHLKAFGPRDNRRHLVRKTNDFLHGFLWRYGRQDPESTSESSYIFFRRHHSASYCIFEIVALLNDFDWVNTKFDREHVEFQYFLTAYSNSLSMSNDILSLRKELKDDETENLAIHKYMNSEKEMEIDEAISDLVKFTNGETHEVKTYGGRLRYQHQNVEAVQDMVDFVNWSLDGHLYWYGCSHRYGVMKLKERHLTDNEYYKLLNDSPRKSSSSSLVQVF